MKYFQFILFILAAGSFAQNPYTLYFLPDSTSEAWIVGTPHVYLYDADGARSEAIRMEYDITKCGWYKKSFADIPDNEALIGLNATGTDSAGYNGILEESYPQKFNLKNLFDTLNTDNLFFSYDNGWHAADPGYIGICTYTVASTIYDTDTINPAFKRAWSGPGSTRTASTGLWRGLVKDKLGANRKPEYNPAVEPFPASYNINAAWTAAYLDSAFNPSSWNNSFCFEMPFIRNADGNWEFDSDKYNMDGTLSNEPIPGTARACGFFPPQMESPIYAGNGGNILTNGCGNACRTLNDANGYRVLNLSTENQINFFNRGLDTTGLPFKNGDFRDLNSHPALWSNATSCPGTGTSRTINTLLCYENHSTFTYQKGQEFYFRGDDDLWVFINDSLALDIGGVHLAVPGMIEVDSLVKPMGLIEGEKYPIDIFFCDRSATESNVKITTNMYFSSKNNFSVSNEFDMDSTKVCATIVKETSSCNTDGDGAVSSGTYCGADLADLTKRDPSYKLSYYMLRTDIEKDTMYLDDATRNENCYTYGDNTRCYSGIRTDKDSLGIRTGKGSYSCGDYDQCGSDRVALSKLNLTEGSYKVYVRLTKSGKSIGKPILLDQFKISTNIHMVWGAIELQSTKTIDTLRNLRGGVQTEKVSVVAGRRVPIYIASGKWKNRSLFTVFNSSEPKKYKLNESEKINTLKFYESESGTDAVSFDKDREFTIGSAGIDTLWVEGDYRMDEFEYSINVDGATDGSMKVKVYLPWLEFYEDSTYTAKIEKPYGVGEPIPFVGTVLPKYIMAKDSTNPKECFTCNFPLTVSSKTNNPAIDAVTKNPVTENTSISIKEGLARIDIRGKIAIEGSDSATMEARGPNEYINASWGGLQFIKPPTPRPIIAHLYDKNGDGIGDSLRIQFSGPFNDTLGNRDNTLLPNIIDVEWEKNKIVSIYYSGSGNTPEKLRAKDSTLDNQKHRAENERFWERCIKNDSLIVIDNEKFSDGILTAGTGNFKVYTQHNKSGSLLVMDTLPGNVLDRISPIAVSAFYTADNKCGSEHCTDKLNVVLSETVFADSLAAEEEVLMKNPFDYCLESRHASCWKPVTTNDPPPTSTKTWGWTHPGDNGYSFSTRYKTLNITNKLPIFGSAKGDSEVEITYHSYAKNGDTTNMPISGDWVKLRQDAIVFRDAAGNPYNPEEIGVRIEGKRRAAKNPVLLGTVNDVSPTAPPLNGIFDPKSPNYGRDSDRYATWLSPEGREAAGKLYDISAGKGNITEFLPLPNGYPADSVRENYPGSVGLIYRPDIFNNIVEFVNGCTKNGTGDKSECFTADGSRPLTEDNAANNVTLHASVYYHTNLGNYVAASKHAQASCKSPLFQNPDGEGDCFSSKSNFYLAWNLRTDNGRFVGVGAYIAVTKVYWQLVYRKKGADAPTVIKFDAVDDVYMYGAKRGK